MLNRCLCSCAAASFVCMKGSGCLVSCAATPAVIPVVIIPVPATPAVLIKLLRSVFISSVLHAIVRATPRGSSACRSREKTCACATVSQLICKFNDRRPTPRGGVRECPGGRRHAGSFCSGCGGERSLQPSVRSHFRSSAISGFVDRVPGSRSKRWRATPGGLSRMVSRMLSGLRSAVAVKAPRDRTAEGGTSRACGRAARSRAIPRSPGPARADSSRPRTRRLLSGRYSKRGFAPTG